MRVPASLSANKTFRLIWWLVTLPLEVARIALMPLAACIYLLTINMTFNIWALIWALLFFHILVLNYQIAGLFDNTTCFFIAIFLYFTSKWAWPIRAMLKKMLNPTWRLRSSVSRKKAVAGIVIPSSSDAKQHRGRMTTRLSPELQGMLVRQD